MTKLLVIDADTILYSSAAQQQLNKCLATNIEHGSQRLFESKTAFNEWAKENNRALSRLFSLTHSLKAVLDSNKPC